MAKKRFTPLPDQCTLLEVFRYDPDTGVLYWSVKRGNTFPGDIAGSIDTGGYLRVSFCNVFYAVHRIVWKMITGEDPTETIDHRDLNRSNNRWSNLREASESQQQANQLKKTWGSNPYRGVYKCGNKGKWLAAITYKGTFHRLGLFYSAEEAYQTYLDASVKYYGEYARSEH